MATKEATSTKTQPTNIYEALVAAQAAIKNVSKNGKNKYDGYAYRGIDDVMDAVHKAFVEAGVVAIPTVLSKAQVERTSRKGELMIHTTLEVQYTFYAQDGTSVSAVVQGEGMDRGDKSINKAMSGAYKYAMFQVLAIPTAEMVDSEADSPEIGQPAQEQRPPQPTRRPAQRPQQEPPQTPAEPDPNTKIPREAAKKLSLIIAEIAKEDQSWWPDFRDLHGLTKTTDIRQGDYNEIVRLANARLEQLKGKKDGDQPW